MANIKSILREIVVILDSIRRKRENNRLRGKGIKKRSPMFRYIRKLISKGKNIQNFELENIIDFLKKYYNESIDKQKLENKNNFKNLKNLINKLIDFIGKNNRIENENWENNELTVYKLHKTGAVSGKMYTRNVYFNSNEYNPAIIYTSKGVSGMKKSRINISDINHIELKENKLGNISKIIRIKIYMKNPKSKPKQFVYVQNTPDNKQINNFLNEIRKLNLKNIKINNNIPSDILHSPINLHNNDKNWDMVESNVPINTKNQFIRNYGQNLHNILGGSQFIHIPNYGKRKVRYQKNGRPYVIVNKKKLKL